MKPSRSSSRQPSAHRVFGSAPIMTKMLPAGRVVSVLVSRSVQVTLDRFESPASAVTSECGCGLMRAEHSIRRTR